MLFIVSMELFGVYSSLLLGFTPFGVQPSLRLCVTDSTAGA